MLRPALLLVALCGLGCLPAHPALSDARAPALRPDTFFLGETRGRGVLHVLARGADSVRVVSQGTALPDESTRLVQRIAIGDEVRERVWTMVPDGPTSWTGSLSDATGPVSIQADGPLLRIRYRTGPLTTIHQRLLLLPDGRTVENRLSARVLGVPVARITETITRAAAPGR